jgi:pimeloyl-ACP methyl ester carboxylesterase
MGVDARLAHRQNCEHDQKKGKPMNATPRNKTGGRIILATLLCALAHPAFAQTYSITPNPATVGESAGTLTFTITRSGSFPAETIYASTTQTEGFSNSSDYTGIANQSVSFTSGATTRTVTVTILNDTTVENSETFGFIVQRNTSDPVSTYLAKRTFTITDDDVQPTTYAITPNPTTVSEGVGTLTFTITRSGGTPAETIYASTTTTEGYANSSDYTGIANQSVSFTSGATTRTVTVTINDDSTVENSETFGFIVQRNTSDPVSTYLAKSTFTITDNDVQPTTYAITPNPTTVGESVGTLTFTITRSGGTPAETIYASTTTTEGYANSSDYTGIANQSVSFTSGATTRTVTVTINDDSTVESSETFGFIVQRNTSDPVSTYLAKSTFTITDNDVQPTTYAITPAPATVGESAGTLTFTITRSGGTPAETIYASTTQTEGYSNSSDYTGIANQSVTFTSGQTTRTVSVTILNDSTVESSETFGFIVQRNTSDPVTTYLDKSTFTITDDDVLPTTYAITPNPATVGEGAGTLTFTITRSGATPVETIYASTTQTEGFANNSDYTGIVNQSVSFTSGQTTRTVTVTISDNSTVENNETFGFIVQRNTSDPVTTYLAKSTFTITDNDVLPTTYSITPNPATVNEDAGTLTFTITRSGATSAETIYASTTQTEGFSNNSDYTGIANQSVSFTSGQTTRTVAVTINNDTTAENNETFGFIAQRNASDPVSTYLAKSTFTITANDVVGAPTIITQPQGQTVNAGANVTFSVTASGTSPLTYQWRKNGVNIAGANNPTLALNSVTAANSGGYSVRISNAYGSVVSDTASLAVLTDGANGSQPAQVSPAPTPTKPPAVDSLVIVTHGFEPFGIINDVSWVNSMADAIRAHAPANWLVIAYTWEGQAWVTPDFALINARIQGGVYAKELAQQNWQHVHLIGHSAGSAFVEAAAKKFKEISPSTVVHSTFLDPYLSLFQVGGSVYGANADWADCYFAQDATGNFTKGPLDHAYSVDVSWADPNKQISPVYCSSSTAGSTPPLLDLVCGQRATSSHPYPHDFYFATIGGTAPGCANGYGFAMSKEGGGWNNRGNYPVGNQPLVLCGPTPPTQNPFPFTLNESLQINALPYGTSAAGVSIGGAAFTLTTHSPTWLAVGVSVSNAVNFVQFDADFTSTNGAEGLLTVYWNTNEIGMVDERVASSGVETFRFALPGTATTGFYTLSFRLDPFTNTASSIMITNVQTGFSGVEQPIRLDISLAASNNTPLLTLSAAPNYNYLVESSTNLTDWTATALLVNTNGTVSFADPAVTNFSKRFYRATAP